MSILSDLGNTIIKATTGQDPQALSADIASAQQQITVAVGTIIALEVIIAFELFLLVVIAVKDRK